MARNRQPPRPLRRRVATRQPRKTLGVFCEGQRTEPEYLDALRREPEVHDGAAVDIRIEHAVSGAVPLTLVRMAVEARNRAIDEEGEIDEFWCVYDVEWPIHHPGLAQARELAKRNHIQLAISNPCFELWLALHFRDYRGFLDNEEARRVRRSHDGKADKGLDGALYMPLRDGAAKRAAVLERFHLENGSRCPDDNPSSGMHRLLASVLPPRT